MTGTDLPANIARDHWAVACITTQKIICCVPNLWKACEKLDPGTCWAYGPDRLTAEERVLAECRRFLAKGYAGPL